MSSDPFKGWWPPTIGDKRSLIESPGKLNFATNWWTSFLFSPRYPLKINMSTRKVIFEKKGKLIFQPLIFRGHVRFFRRLMILPQLLKDLFSLKALFFGVTLRSIGPRVSVGFRKSPKNHENHHCSTVNVDLGKHHGRAAPPNNMPAAKKKKQGRRLFPTTSPGWNLRFQVISPNSYLVITTDGKTCQITTDGWFFSHAVVTCYLEHVDDFRGSSGSNTLRCLLSCRNSSRIEK